MMKRMRILKKRDAQIEELLQEIPKQEDEKVRELMEFRLGLAYLSVYEFNKAKTIIDKFNEFLKNNGGVIGIAFISAMTILLLFILN